MAQNCIKGPGVVIEITAAATVTSGQIVQVGPNLAGVALTSAASGEIVSVDIFGSIYRLPATAGEDVAAWLAASVSGRTGSVHRSGASPQRGDSRPFAG